MVFAEGFLNALYNALKPFVLPPLSIAFLTLVSLGISLVQTLVYRATINVEELRRASALMREYAELQKKALKTGDRKLMLKAKKMKPTVMREQAKVLAAQMRMFLYFAVPLFLVFMLLSYIYSGVPIAKLPFKIPLLGLLHRGTALGEDVFGFIAWYFLSSGLFTTVLYKVMGVSM